ncbi:MAG: hypothetical protein LRZ94_00870 [Candidatus Pacebacteria bacterium]|nr:hypothetical protein [Candidatus Paceibacterota bacterium]
MKKNYFLEFKFSNRGYKGYAGLYCRLYVDGELAGSAGGGGYDMKGVCLGQWIEKEFKEQIKMLANKELEEALKAPKNERYYNSDGGGIYGLIIGKGKDEGAEGISISCDGATGISQMFKILEAIGFESRQNRKGNNWLNSYQIFKPFYKHFEEELKELTEHKDATIRRHAEGLRKALQ